ncbi:MAG TPA: XdhC/CoxI family protein [Kofleriaceae bacterium]
MQHDDVLDRAAAWRGDGLAVAIATVVRTWGSSPRPAGSKLAINERGAFVGSVSGGCIEAAVIDEALAILRGAPARVLEFGVADEVAWSVGLACGGRVEVYVEPLAEMMVHAMSGVLLTNLRDGTHRLVDATTAPPELGDAVRRALASDRAEVVGDGIFVEPFNPPLRLIVVGAVHVAVPLAQMARLAGFAVTIVEPRAAWATAERFPGGALVRAWPDEALRELAPDARTAIVTLTHDPKLDDPALVAALGSPAFYVGCLGSVKTHASRLERLGTAGVAAHDLGRLHGPVGLRIGARSPAEIAVSILAEIVAELRKPA